MVYSGVIPKVVCWGVSAGGWGLAIAVTGDMW